MSASKAANSTKAAKTSKQSGRTPPHVHSATLTVAFGSPEEAKTAKSCLDAEDVSERASASVAANKNLLTANITAADFTALRARTTSILRDLRVVVDSQKTLAKRK